MNPYDGIMGVRRKQHCMRKKDDEKKKQYCHEELCFGLFARCNLGGFIYFLLHRFDLEISGVTVKGTVQSIEAKKGILIGGQ